MRTRLAFVIAIILGLSSLSLTFHTPGSHDAAAGRPSGGDRAGDEAAFLNRSQPATPALATPALAIPAPSIPVATPVILDPPEPVTPEPPPSPEPTPVTPPPASATPEPTAAAETDTGGPPSRLVDEGPGPVTLWILLTPPAYAAQDDGTCAGTGPYDDLQPGGVVSLLDADAGAAHVESVMIEAAGKVYRDTVLGQDVCAFRLEFSRVPPGTTLLVDLDRLVLGSFEHVAPAADPDLPPLYVIVAGE